MAGPKNGTAVTRFILLGFSDYPRLSVILFLIFLVMYLVTLAWNLSLITLIKVDSHLHTPMYFFLPNLSFLDICYVSSTVPKMLSDFFKEKKTISFGGCTAQYFIFSGMGLSEICLLAAMAYDRYAAICNPLLYTSIMSPTLCVWMVAGSYMCGFSGSFIQLCSLLQLHFCGPDVIHHFFCDLPQLLVLSCSDTLAIKILLSVLSMVFGVLSVLIIMVSYGHIVEAILKMSSAQGRSKAFNTCASHLMAVTLFYASGLFVYLRPTFSDSFSHDKVASIFYTMITPMLNPLIYSLRNKEIKEALKRWEKRVFA
ncbi:olfactory receptor 1440-like [Trichosurus vulpecula]|uniref:olfactory receptor 1440-like n=1 Tax=Trichosurus vulpecula TaxID=9337 RepID=UPI00186B0A6A|nr:olfactory receptor 1440-like [Trichosurus vulpecula]XP_036620574.1 olfactory receptor 1440-like [Trichosurus vulpecula]